jgi:hypothetical protein
MAQIPAKPVAKPVTAQAPAVAWPTPIFKGERGPSVIGKDLLGGVILASGFFGSGKTTFLAGIENPANVVMLDYETKGRSIAEKLGIENYFAVMEEGAAVLGMNFRPRHVFERTQKIIEALPEGRFTTLILDNVAHLQEGCLALVQGNPMAYGIDPQKAVSGSMGGAWPGVKYVLQSLFGLARAKGVQTIGIASQMKSVWADKGPVLNKFKKQGSDILDQLSILTVIMREPVPKYAPVPSALVMKEQLGMYRWDPKLQEMVVERRLPTKLPRGTMAEVRRYLREGTDWTKLLPEEVAQPEEFELYSTVFSRAQLKALEELAKAATLLASEGGEGEVEA